MKKAKHQNYYGRMIFCLAVLFSSSIIFAQASDEDAASKLLIGLIAAFEKQDITLHEEIWLQSDELRVIGVFENSNFFGWNEFRDHLEKTFKSAKKIDFIIHETKISISKDGGTGWFFMSVDETIELPAKTIFLENMRYTGIIVKENEKWRIIQFHGSIPANVK